MFVFFFFLVFLWFDTVHCCRWHNKRWRWR